MLKEILCWYQGYVEVELCGYTSERFVNLCRNKGILLWDVHIEKGHYLCKISLEDYWNTKKIAVKTHVMPRIQRRCGFPFWLRRVGKRKGMISGFVSGLLLIYFLSIRVWDISFVGQSLYTEERLLKFLSDMQVHVGMTTKKVDCQKIEEKIRLAYPDIGWVSAELKGTKLTISMVETNMPVPVMKKEGGYHLIASHNGVVKKMITRSGTPMVHVGDTVKKGDILIAGILEYIDDSQTVIKSEKVCADGDILLETKYAYKDSCDKTYQKKIYTDYQKKILEISVGNKKIFFANPFKTLNTTRKYDIIANIQQISLSKSFTLPFSYGIRCYREYEEKAAEYTREEGKEILNKRFSNYLEKIRQNGVSVLKHNVRFQANQKAYVANGNLFVTEPVTEYKLVDESEWRSEEQDGLNRNNN
ncbi:MAG: sporulation protein YqfD [Lachnospiraceae bacterium]|nr:sporulation protein YqfD [Lachnospiraceae bacterium]